MAPRKKKWIHGANLKPHALHQQLGYNPSDPLPIGLLKDIQQANIGTHVRGHFVNRKLKRRVNFALNSRSWRH